VSRFPHSYVDHLPITSDFGRVKSAGLGAVESGTYEGGFREVFGRALERPAGRADADAQFPGDDLPRGAGCPEGGDRSVTVSVEATAECTALLKKERFDFLDVLSDIPRIERPPEPPEIVEGKIHWLGKIRATADIVDRQFQNFVSEVIEQEKE
jgi:hypothetical protein